jgi:hypothetical protein
VVAGVNVIGWTVALIPTVGVSSAVGLGLGLAVGRGVKVGGAIGVWVGCCSTRAGKDVAVSNGVAGSTASSIVDEHEARIRIRAAQNRIPKGVKTLPELRFINI